MLLSETLPWISPLDAAQQLAEREECWALLYSGQRLLHTGRFSYLCLYPQEHITGNDFSPLVEALGRVPSSEDAAPFENAWFGYLGYELLHAQEKLPEENRAFITLPRLHFIRFGVILQFDHDDKKVLCHRASHLPPVELSIVLPPAPPALQPHIAHVTSSMTRSQYLQAVQKTKEAILRGDFYQANVTRKFMGEFTTSPDMFALFRKLSALSPAAYSAYFRLGETAILSSSPESFLSISAGGEIETRPIKGTAARLNTPEEDDAQRLRLEQSEKDRAENLMIVDLMRNDLARSCELGSVQVKKLFEVSTYATLHHMASTIIGQKRADISTLQAVRHCFPPGSMTGAPKISAMQWCLEQERICRGIYSGALGWFGGDGSCNLSVVIRTLITHANRWEFQVGGGIVADSVPEQEWQETLTKARAIASTLEIPIKLLENI